MGTTTGTGPGTNAPTGSAAPSGEPLTEQTPTDNSLFTPEQGTAAIDGVQYTDVLHTTNCYGGYVGYPIGKNGTKFDVVIGLGDNSPHAGLTFTVLADDTRIFHNVATVGKPFHPVFVVSGVLRLRIEGDADESRSTWGIGVLADPTLIA